MYDDPIALLTFALVIITGYYAWRTQQMLGEQRKAAECQFKPDISFPREIRPRKKIFCIVARNHAFNISVTVTIGKISDKQNLGGVFIYPNQSLNVPTGHSQHFDLQKLLKETEVGSVVPVKIEIRYQSSTEAEYVEEFSYDNCIVTEKGIKITGGYVGNHRLTKAPWFGWVTRLLMKLQ